MYNKCVPSHGKVLVTSRNLIVFREVPYGSNTSQSKRTISGFVNEP